MFVFGVFPMEKDSRNVEELADDEAAKARREFLKILDQLLPQGGQRPVFHFLWQGQPSATGRSLLGNLA